jgi:hypothetical protein
LKEIITYLCFEALALLLLLHLQQECAVDMWQDTPEGDRGTDKGIEFFVSANSELEVAGSDTLDLEIFGSILSSNRLASETQVRQLYPAKISRDK